MAIPKTLRPIPAARAEKLIADHIRREDGHWEGVPYGSDFVYGKDFRLTLLRPPCWNGGEWETGKVSL